MKITHNKVGQNLNLSDLNKTDKADSANKSEKASSASVASALGGSADATSVNLSSKAQDMKKMKEIATNTPDVDEAKVARLQAMIDGGTYKVDAASIADRMVDEQLGWN